MKKGGTPPLENFFWNRMVLSVCSIILWKSMTRETKERIQFLLIRYLEGTASPDERQRLSQFLADEPEEDAWLELMEELMSTEQPMTGYDPVEWQPFIEQLRQRRTRGRMIPLRWWAAAAVLVLLAGGIWWIAQMNRMGRASGQQQVSVKDLQPGGNHAVLTLAGGKQIVLDSAATGVLTQQGNAQVRKLSNGQLAYNKTGEKAKEVLYNTLSTPRGGQYQLTLPDGSQVWLNAASSITYPTAFVASTRTVKVTGEAYFEVVHNERQPFRVQSGELLIEDIGTSFNINAYADEPSVKTTLVEGKVKVSKGGDFRVLSPGAQVESFDGGGLRVVAHADVQQALAWKNGIFSFRDADLATVMRQLGRWYDIEVEYEGPVPAGTFDGEIGRSLTLSQVLQGLAQTRIRYTIVGDHKIIIKQ